MEKWKKRKNFIKTLEKITNVCYNTEKKTISLYKEKKLNYLYALCASGLQTYLGDLIVIVVALIFMLVCARKGFINCLFKFLATIVALVVAFTLAKTFVSITGGLFGMQAVFEESFTEALVSVPGFNVDVAGQNLEELLASQDVSALITSFILKNYANIEVPAGTTLAMLVGESAALWVTALIAGIILFFLVKLVMLLLRKFLTAIINKIKLIGTLNRLLGAVVGLIEGLLFVSIAASVLSLINSAEIAAVVANSRILEWLANNNPVVWLLGLFL